MISCNASPFSALSVEIPTVTRQRSKASDESKLTSVRSLERIVHHRIHDIFDVGRMRITGTGVDGSLVRHFVRCVTSLFVKDRQHLSCAREGHC